MLVVDDDPMARQLLRTILRTDDIEVIAEAADDEVVTAVQAHHPDVVLVDLQMRRVDGVRRRRALGPSGPA
ncbi:response regulator [Cellulosimicrobium sp. CpK407]|uniref:response regulator n=1 Tax=Cellulosimicrobium sp. CpK407 TaxID=3229847 RepID=UPI003F3541ED